MNQPVTYAVLSDDMKRFVDQQYRDAYGLIDACRYENGLYADAYHTFESAPGPMGSIAATGVGLVALTLAHLEQWDPDAVGKVHVTLELVTGTEFGSMGPVARDRQTGFFYHFFDATTGAAWKGSEISTIDTAILVAGALFAARHLGQEYPTIEKMAMQLLHSIAWERAIVAPDSGAINMVIEDGAGQKHNKPFSEYAIVAYLASLANPESPLVSGPWRSTYAPDQLERLLHLEYRGLRLFGQMTHQRWYLSSFVYQFPFYLIPDYAKSETYRSLLGEACAADRLSWQESAAAPSYIWGHGAGNNNGLPEGRAGYRVDNVGDSSGVASAYIVSGFLPVFPPGVFDLYALYRLHLPYDHYQNAADPEDERKLRMAYRFGLQRYSWQERQPPSRWYPERITIIDWSSMLYGMAALRRGMHLFTAGSS